MFLIHWKHLSIQTAVLIRHNSVLQWCLLVIYQQKLSQVYTNSNPEISQLFDKRYLKFDLDTKSKKWK